MTDPTPRATPHDHSLPGVTHLPYPEETDGPPHDEAARSAYRLESDAHAAWAMRKLAEIEERQGEIRKIATDEVTRLMDRVTMVVEWRDAEVGRFDRDYQFFVAILEEYAQRRRAETDGEVKTISTPWGTVKTRRNEATAAIADDAAFIRWCAENEHYGVLVKHKESVDLVAVRSEVTAGRLSLTPEGMVIDTESGTVVAGLSVVPARISVTITPTPPKE